MYHTLRSQWHRSNNNLNGDFKVGREANGFDNQLSINDKNYQKTNFFLQHLNYISINQIPIKQSGLPLKNNECL